MMHTKRWIVTYTRHMQQKRKVYHDGVLEICGSGDKVMLYDDCEKLIDSRTLKHDEIIECGASLAFTTHLVDIGEPEGNHNPQTDLIVSGRDVKLNKRAESQGQKFQKSTLRSMPPQNYSNAIHSSIKENKISKLQNRPSQFHSNTIPSSIRVSNKTEIGRDGVLQGRPNETQTALKEWDALYTTQKTQKAKKYHDGILRLAVRSTHMTQIILLSEEGTVLSSKCLKSVDCIETGHSCEFPNYLVEIGDPRIPLGDDLQKVPLKQLATGKVSTIPIKDDNIKTLPNDALQKGPSKQVPSSSSSSIDKLPTTKKDDSNKTLHNACQIPSILKKLLREESLGQGNLPVKRDNSSQFVQQHSSDKIRLHVHKGKMLEIDVPGTRYSRKTMEDDHKGDSQEPNVGGSTQTGPSGSTHFNSILIDPDCEGNSAPLEYSTSSSQLPWACASKTSTGKSDMEYNGNKCVEVATSTEGPEISDASDCHLPGITQKNPSKSIFSGGLSKELVGSASENVLAEKSFGCFSNGEQHISDPSSNLLKENISIKGCCVSGIGGNGISSANDMEYESSNKLLAENTKADGRCERVPSLGESSPARVAKDAGCMGSVSLSKKHVTLDNFPYF